MRCSTFSILSASSNDGRTTIAAPASQGQGIARDRLRITAAADTEPLPESGDRSALRHDRAEVLMLDTFATDYIGPRTE